MPLREGASSSAVERSRTVNCGSPLRFASPIFAIQLSQRRARVLVATRPRPRILVGCLCRPAGARPASATERGRRLESSPDRAGSSWRRPWRSLVCSNAVRHSLLCLLPLPFVGCAADLSSDQLDLVGGLPTWSFPAVLLLEKPSGRYCSGSLVAPNVVLTAAHCQIEPGAEAIVMDFDERLDSQLVVEVVSHRYHKGGDSFSDHDIALVRLADDLAEAPLPIKVARDESNLIGAELTVVGLGVVDGVALNGGGEKRVGTFIVTSAIKDYITGDGGDERRSICFGDSGGPALLDVDGTATVIGVTRSHAGICERESEWTRVDSYAAEFVVPFIDAWSGPCRLDATCVTAGCRTPDPDCAPCGIDGTCSAGCEQLDLDCPVGSFFGEECSSNDDCESRLCLDDPYAERASYCSQSCGATTTCPNLAVCQEIDRASVCVIEPPAPASEHEGGCASAQAQATVPIALVLLALLTSRRPRLPGAARRNCARP
jgi:hypothetical protein